jgi:hypothetical protein
MQNGTPEVLAADTVIGIAPARPATTFAPGDLPVHTVGDCREVAFLEGATNSALTVARSIG